MALLSAPFIVFKSRDVTTADAVAAEPATIKIMLIPSGADATVFPSARHVAFRLTFGLCLETQTSAWAASSGSWMTRPALQIGSRCRSSCSSQVRPTAVVIATLSPTSHSTMHVVSALIFAHRPFPIVRSVCRFVYAIIRAGREHGRRYR